MKPTCSIVVVRIPAAIETSKWLFGSNGSRIFFKTFLTSFGLTANTRRLLSLTTCWLSAVVTIPNWDYSKIIFFKINSITNSR